MLCVTPTVQYRCALRKSPFSFRGTKTDAKPMPSETNARTNALSLTFRSLLQAVVESMSRTFLGLLKISTPLDNLG